MAKKKSAKTIAYLLALVTLISFLYKLFLAFLTPTTVLFIAAVSTLVLFLCKLFYAKFLNETRRNKKKAYLAITLFLLLYSVIFILFSILKINDIDLSSSKTYEGWLGAVIIAFLLLMFILSIIGLKKALDKTDLMIIGIKEVTFVSALMDLVIIEEYVSRIILRYIEVSWMDVFNGYFALAIGVILVLVFIRMIIRFFGYKIS